MSTYNDGYIATRPLWMDLWKGHIVVLIYVMAPIMDVVGGVSTTMA